MSFVFDASAVLAVILREPGGEFVYASRSGSQISAVNVGEVFSTLLDGGIPYDEVQRAFSGLNIRVRTFREGHAWRVGALRPLTRQFGLSYGDRACIMQSEFADLPILTSDLRMAKAGSALGIDIRMIRERRD